MRSNFETLVHLLLLALGLAISAAVIRAHSTTSTEFTQDYLAGKALINSQSIYGENISSQAVQLFPQENQRIENFHPPLNSLIFAPFGIANYRAAHLIWCLIIILLYFSSIFLILNTITVPSSVRRHVPYFALLWWPAIYCVGQANISILVTALVAFSLSRLKPGKNGLSAAALGAAAAIKLYPALIGLLFLAKRDSRAISVMALTFCGLNLLAYLVVGSADFWHYYAVLVPRDVAEWSAFPLNSAISGLLVPLLTPNEFIKNVFNAPLLANYLSYLTAAVLIVITLIRFSAKENLSSADTNSSSLALFATLVPLMLLASPITWPHAFCALLIPIAYLIHPLRNNASKGAWVLFVTALLLLSIPEVYVVRTVLQSLAPEKLSPAWFLTLKFPFYAICILWGLCLKFAPKTFSERS